MMMVIGDRAIFLRAVSYTASNSVNLLLSSPVPLIHRFISSTYLPRAQRQTQYQVGIPKEAFCFEITNTSIWKDQISPSTKEKDSRLLKCKASPAAERK